LKKIGERTRGSGGKSSVQACFLAEHLGEGVVGLGRRSTWGKAKGGGEWYSSDNKKVRRLHQKGEGNFQGDKRIH